MAYATGGSLLVREEYLLFAECLRNAREDMPADSMQGALLLGQLAIGKSYFLLFFLIQCIARQETVLFTSCSGQTYLFDQAGVVQMATVDVDPELHLPPFTDAASRVWSLVDCPEGKNPIPSHLTYGARSLFCVAALSPDRSRYKAAEKEPVRLWWMSTWTDDELLALLRSVPVTELAQKQRERYPTFDADAIRTLCSAVGPCPGDILRFLTDP
ncbi:hypothetical protein LXA43DRAFT_898329, partial [Ganoderma leucocontextum]